MDYMGRVIYAPLLYIRYKKNKHRTDKPFGVIVFPILLLDTDAELITPPGNHLATDSALDIFETIFNIVLFNNITGY